MIKVKNLTVTYGKTEILKNLNFSVEKGRFVSVIGPNGCGKTTLLHTLSRLISCRDGEIILDGKNLSDYKRKELAQKTALLPQFRDVPDLTVFSFVLSGRYPYTSNGNYRDIDVSKTREAMERTGITSLADRNLKTLSGGERQRAYIALCLAQDTDIILLDEPTTYLDVGHQFDVLNLIKSLTDKTVVVVMHDITQALRYSDEVILMNNGEILLCSSPKEAASSGYIENVFGISLDRENFIVFPKPPNV